MLLGKFFGSWGEGVEKPERLPQVHQAVAGDRPNRQCRSGSVRGACCRRSGRCRSPVRSRTCRRTARLVEDFADTALPDALVFPARRVHAVHHDAGHRLHPGVPLSARLALDQPGKQFPVRQRHGKPSFRFYISLRAKSPPGIMDMTDLPVLMRDFTRGAGRSPPGAGGGDNTRRKPGQAGVRTRWGSRAAAAPRGRECARRAPRWRRRAGASRPAR